MGDGIPWDGSRASGWRPAGPCSSWIAFLGWFLGGTARAEELASARGTLTVARVGHLLHRHGAAIDELLDLIAEVPDLAERAAEAQPDDRTADPVRRQAADLRTTRPDTAA